MVSRDTSVHLAALALALLVALAADYFGLWFESGPAAVAAYLLFNGLALGGAHLYLALRGEGGMVPSEARWRYVGALAVLLGVGAASLYVGDRTVGDVELGTLGLALVLVTVIAYLVVESVAGYRETRPE